MKTTRLLIGLLCLSGSLLAGCSSASSVEDDIDQGAVRQGESSTDAYEIESDSIGKFYFRLTRNGAAITGRAMTPRGSNVLAPMDVKGTVEADGTYRLVWTIIEKGSMDIPLVLRDDGGALVGTFGAGSDQQPIKLAPIKADRDVPLVSAARVTNESDRNRTCQLDIQVMEVFGMKDRAREDALNKIFAKSAADATAACSGTTTAVLGTVGPAVVNAELSTYMSSFIRDLPNDESEVIGVQRVNQLVNGAKISLVGDVLAPGSEAKVTELINEAIDRTIGRGLIEVIGVARKEELKVKMAERLASGKLGSDFLLGSQGLVFGTDKFDFRVLTLHVPYTALKEKGVLAPQGKARSAWEPSGGTQ